MHAYNNKYNHFRLWTRNYNIPPNDQRSIIQIYLTVSSAISSIVLSLDRQMERSQYVRIVSIRVCAIGAD